MFFNSTDFSILNFEVYMLNVSDLNAAALPEWQFFYDFRSAYKVNSLRPSELHRLANRMTTAEGQQDFLDYAFRFTAGYPDKLSLHALRCHMLWLLNSEFEHCLKHKTNSFESIEVKHLVWYLSVATIFLACFAVVAVYVVVAFSSKTQNSAVMP